MKCQAIALRLLIFSHVNLVCRSFDDMGEPNQDPRWEPFVDMRDYLRRTFPVV